jgi:hypothetical protein
VCVCVCVCLCLCECVSVCVCVCGGEAEWEEDEDEETRRAHGSLTVCPASVLCQKLAFGMSEILPPHAHTSVAETQLSPIIVYDDLPGVLASKYTLFHVAPSLVQ